MRSFRYAHGCLLFSFLVLVAIANAISAPSLSLCSNYAVNDVHYVLKRWRNVEAPTDDLVINPQIGLKQGKPIGGWRIGPSQSLVQIMRVMPSISQQQE